MTADRRSWRWTAWRGVAMLTVGAAVLGLGALASSAGSNGGTAVTAAAPAAPTGPTPALAPADLRLEAWPGLRGDLVRDEVVYADEYRARERLIQSCMREHGFTYVPIPLQYGPTATGYQEDPNARVVEGLSPTDQRAYFLALANSTSAEDTGSGFDLDTPGRAGCIGEAHHTLPGIFRVPGGLANAVSETRGLAMEDAAVVTAGQGWRTCVAERLGGTVPEGLVWPGDIDRLADDGLLGRRGQPTAVQLHGTSDRCRGELDRAFDAALVRSEAEFVRAHQAELAAHRDQLVADHRELGLSVAELQ